MAVNNPPAFLQNAGATHNAETTRQAVSIGQSGPRAASSMVPRGGVHPHLGGVCAVTQNGSPNMSVNVATGVVTVPGTEGATQADYVCIVASTTNLTITTAHASLARIDIVVAQVQDSAYSGVTNAWQLAVVAGTPAGSPTAPAAPNNSIVLAQVTVPAAATQILNANITDVRPYSAVGLIYVKDTSSYPSPAMGGMVCYVKSTGQLAVYNENTATWSNPSGSQFLQRVIFTASGSFTKATYPGLRKVRVCVQADGGGGGGSGTAAASQSTTAGGGGGGGYSESWIDASALAASVTVTVGTGGTAGAAGAGGNGGNGTGSSFGATVVANPGLGGSATTSGGSSTTAVYQAGGAGGTVAGAAGDIQIAGGAGVGGWKDATLSAGGTGGNSYMGGGGVGTRIGSAAAQVGVAGGQYGGGGSGSCAGNTATGLAGGAGAAGIVFLDLYV